MSVVHRMTGYHKGTEALEIEHGIPEETLREICEFVHVPPADEDATGSYPLETAVARRVAATIGKQINSDCYDWFIEPFAE